MSVVSDSWTIPTELAKRLISPNGMIFLIRAKMRGAELTPCATVIRRNDWFLAEFHFQKPIGPERQTSVLAQLGVRPEARP